MPVLTVLYCGMATKEKPEKGAPFSTSIAPSIQEAMDNGAEFERKTKRVVWEEAARLRIAQFPKPATAVLENMRGAARKGGRKL